jgi:sarcosine oxidase
MAIFSFFAGVFTQPGDCHRMDRQHDVIVLGCGGIGSAALSHLAGRGLKVLGIDRFHPPHDLGSSHGETRIIRKAYFEHPDYVPLLQRAYQLWDELTERTAESARQHTAYPALLERCGLLAAGSLTGEVIPGVIESAARHRLPVERLEPAETQRRFPMFSIPNDLCVIFESDAGFLWVERCVEAHLQDAKRRGARLLTGKPVTEIQYTPDSVRVRTDDTEFSAGALVVTAGPWTAQLLPDYGRHIEIRRKLLFWHPVNLPIWSDLSRAPGYMIEHPVTKRMFYGFPSIDGATVKVAEHTGGGPVSDPTLVNRQVLPDEGNAVSEFVTSHLRGSSGTAVRSAVCMYSMTPDGHFLIDRMDSAPIVVAAGFSGHGFKFSSVMGEVIADLVQTGRSRWSIDFLSARRLNSAMS